MTIVITTKDSKMFAATTPSSVVQRMLESNVFTCAKSVEEYMRTVSLRYSNLEGVFIRHDTADHFLTDLESCKHIAITKGH